MNAATKFWLLWSLCAIPAASGLLYLYRERVRALAAALLVDLARLLGGLL